MDAKRTMTTVAVMVVLVGALGGEAFAGRRGGGRGGRRGGGHGRKDRTKIAVSIGGIGGGVVLRGGKVARASLNVERAAGKLHRAQVVVPHGGRRRRRGPVRIGRPVHVGRHGIPVGRHGGWGRRIGGHGRVNRRSRWNRKYRGGYGRRWYRSGCWVNPTVILGNFGSSLAIRDDVVTVWIVNDNGSESAVRLTKREYGLGYIGPKGEYYSTMPSNDQLKMLYGLGATGAENGSVVVWVSKRDGTEAPVMLIVAEGGYVGPEGEFYSSMPTARQLEAVYGD